MPDSSPACGRPAALRQALAQGAPARDWAAFVLLALVGLGHDGAMHAARIIEIHPDAPPKPALGEACNGCGVCCLAGPCPLGVMLSRRLKGACVALRWDGARYVCGALTAHPSGVRGWLVKRWISSGSGCDCSLEVAGKP